MSLSTLYIPSLLSVLLYLAYRKWSQSCLSDIPGPTPESFWLGNLRELFQCQAGEGDFKLQAQYGHIARLRTSIGGELLWISDPKALQYIYQTSAYRFEKTPERRSFSRLHSGHGLTWAEGETHKRQRKVMLPAFGTPETKAFVPVFMRAAQSITVRWKDMLATCRGQSQEIDIPRWLSKATLNAVGEAAFDYQFDAFEDTDSDVVKAYSGFLTIVFGMLSIQKIFMFDVIRLIPLRAIEWFQNRLSNATLDKARECERLTLKVAKELLEGKAEALQDGEGSRDIFSLLVKANASENEKVCLSDEELYAEMRTILFAGHETTSNTICWALLELARHPDVQEKLRQEIHEYIISHGVTELTASDFDSMPFLQAVLKETLRLHCVLVHTFRQAAQDDVLPLAHPVTTKSGKRLTELPIAKGTRVLLSIAAYNRDPELWGADSHSFDPERWLDGRIKRAQSVGVYSSLLTFAGGIHACIGWRFAIYEIQAFLVELVSNFKFAPTDATKKLRRELCGVTVPTMEGDRGKITLPLTISLAEEMD